MQLHDYYKSFFDTENEIREILNLPKIGEGWISETNLYYEIKNSFPGIAIVHHGKPTWLGRQHLDIYIPRYNIGIEYQGDQHFKSIDFFGGVESFDRNKIRDKEKKSKCNENNCKLIYVLPNYLISDIIGEISEIIERG